MTNEKFCLRWNDFESNISVAFREIREEKDFFDCTLSCGARQIQAHKLILSACSPFFRSTLRQNPHPHPLLYLKGVEFTDLQAVLNFMYHGEVNVAQEELNSFLSVAEDLQVKGLTQNKEKSNRNSTPLPPFARNQTKISEKSPRSPKPPKPLKPTSYADDIEEVMPVIKQEVPSQLVKPASLPQPMVAVPQAYQEQDTSYQEQALSQVEETYEDEEYEYGEFGEEEGYEVDGFEGNAGSGGLNKEYTCGDSAVAALLVHQGASCYACASCGKTSAQRTDLMKHIISKHVVTQAVSCQFCGKKYKNQNSLQVHISQNHRELWQQTKKMG